MRQIEEASDASEASPAAREALTPLCGGSNGGAGATTTWRALGSSRRWRRRRRPSCGPPATAPATSATRRRGVPGRPCPTAAITSVWPVCVRAQTTTSFTLPDAQREAAAASAFDHRPTGRVPTRRRALTAPLPARGSKLPAAGRRNARGIRASLRLANFRGQKHNRRAGSFGDLSP